MSQSCKCENCNILSHQNDDIWSHGICAKVEMTLKSRPQTG